MKNLNEIIIVVVAFILGISVALNVVLFMGKIGSSDVSVPSNQLYQGVNQESTCYYKQLAQLIKCDAMTGDNQTACLESADEKYKECIANRGF